MTLEDLKSELYKLESEWGDLESDKEDIEADMGDLEDRMEEIEESIKEQEEYQKEQDLKELEKEQKPKKLKLAYQINAYILTLTNKLNALPLNEKRERKKLKEELWKLKEVIVI